MVVFEVKSGIRYYTCRKPYEVYEIIDWLLHGQDPQTAIDASSWCELACIGEVYEHDKFTVEIVES